MNDKDDLPWDIIYRANVTPSDASRESFVTEPIPFWAHNIRDYYAVPKKTARELWKLKKWNVPREQLQNSRAHVLELKQENERLRKALELYGDQSKWMLVKGNAMYCLRIFEKWVHAKPWIIAQEALKGKEIGREDKKDSQESNT